MVYLPQGGEVTVDLAAASGEIAVEWFNPETGETLSAKNASGGVRRAFQAPIAGHVVLYLRKPSWPPGP